jgi:hypothetical protein
MKINNYSQKIGSKNLQGEDYPWFKWKIFVDEPPEVLDTIAFVDYFLHPTFVNPRRRIDNRFSQFALESEGWGEFVINGKVKLRDGTYEDFEYFLSLSKPYPSEEKEWYGNLLDKKESEDVPECLIMIPFEDYHYDFEGPFFRGILEELIIPAIKLAELQPVSPHFELKSNIISDQVNTKIQNAPMAICDISSSNPNVLFELGLRIGHRQPVIVMVEESAKTFFDLSKLTTFRYVGRSLFSEIQDRQLLLADLIRETMKKGP